MSFESNPDPGRTLGQFGLAVLALVVGAALLFFAIDRFSDDPAASTEPPAPTAGADDPSATPTDTATPDGESTEDEDEPTDEPTEDPTEDATEDATDEPTEGATEDATEDDEPAADRIPPGEISVQILDGIRDGGDRAVEIQEELESDGYRVVAFNPSSIDFDETTVFWTEGYEDEARQVADDYGWDDVVFNDIWSETVNVHVAVGRDEQ